MNINYPEIGVCGLSCRLCPMYHIAGESRCGGCKTEARMEHDSFKCYQKLEDDISFIRKNGTPA